MTFWLGAEEVEPLLGLSCTLFASSQKKDVCKHVKAGFFDGEAGNDCDGDADDACDDGGYGEGDGVGEWEDYQDDDYDDDAGDDMQ